MTTVFISYSRADQARIDTLIQELQDLGLHVWIDRSGIRGGEQWRLEIVNAIQNCDVFLLCMSSASVASDNVRREVDIASGEGKQIIPLRLENVQYPPEWKYQLAGVQWIDHQDKHWTARLMAAIGISQEAPVAAQRPSREEPGKQEKRLPWGWASLSILVLVIICIALAYSQMPGQILSPTATVTDPAPTAAVMTDTPSPSETPTAIPPLVLFEDTFVDNRHEWQLEDSNFRIEYGKLISSVICPFIAADYCGSYLYIPFNFPKDFRLELDVTAVDLLPDTKIGIGFQVRRNEDDFYYINYYVEDGRYEVRATYSQNNLGLVPETLTDVMNQGIGSTNRFGIELNDTVITPILNGQKLTEGEDTHLSAAGSSFLIVYVSQGETVTIELDNLTVEEIK